MVAVFSALMLLQIGPVNALEGKIVAFGWTVLGLGIVSILAVGWHISHELREIKTVMTHPEIGILGVVNRLREDRHDLVAVLTNQGHAIHRLEEHANIEKTEHIHPKGGSLNRRS